MTTAQNSRFFALINEEVQGPFDYDTIKTKLQAFDIRRDTRVCREGSEEWVPLHEHRLLAHLVSGASGPRRASSRMLPVIVLLSLILVMQFVQAWITSHLPESWLRLQAEMVIEAKRATDAKELADLAARIEFDERMRKQAAFDAALAHIPADIPEPQRSEAARNLLKIKQEEANTRKPGESETDFAARRALWRVSQP